MLHLQSRRLCALRAASHLLFSTATSPAQFAAEDYLVSAFGLAPAQAVKASRYLPNLKSSSNPDAVRAFLDGIGFARADVAAAAARDPRFLCSSVDKTLAPKVAQLRGLGLSPPQISRLVAVVPGILQCPSWIYRLPFYVSLLGSLDELETALKRHPYLLGQDIESVVKPNMAFLLRCGLSASDIAKLFTRTGKLMAMKPERVEEMVARAEKLGVSRNSGMFKSALLAVCNLSLKRISTKIDYLKMALGCAEAEQAVCKLPNILTLSEDKVGRTVEFLSVEVGLEPLYIAHRPAMLNCSLERRLMPRHYVIKVLKAKGLVKNEIGFFGVVCATEKTFVGRFIDPYKEHVLGLADVYAAGCAEKMLPEGTETHL